MLLLARGDTRQHEIAVRYSPGRFTRHNLVRNSDRIILLAGWVQGSAFWSREGGGHIRTLAANCHASKKILST